MGLALGVSLYLVEERERVCFILVINLFQLVPHCALWGYVIKRMFLKYCHKCQNKVEGERERLLNNTTDGVYKVNNNYD